MFLVGCDSDPVKDCGIFHQSGETLSAVLKGWGNTLNKMYITVQAQLQKGWDWTHCRTSKCSFWTTSLCLQTAVCAAWGHLVMSVTGLGLFLRIRSRASLSALFSAQTFLQILEIFWWHNELKMIGYTKSSQFFVEAASRTSAHLRNSASLKCSFQTQTSCWPVAN